MGDIGARFETSIDGRATIFRFNIDNITGINYWVSSSFLGSPRTFSGVMYNNDGRQSGDGRQ